jgi:hypothetical protein
MMNYHLHIELATCCDTPGQLIRKINTKLKKLRLFAQWDGTKDQCYANIQFYDLGLWKLILNTVAKAKTQCGCCCLTGDAGSMGQVYLDIHISNETACYRYIYYQKEKEVGSYLYDTRNPIQYINGDWEFKKEMNI